LPGSQAGISTLAGDSIADADRRVARVDVAAIDASFAEPVPTLAYRKINLTAYVTARYVTFSHSSRKKFLLEALFYRPHMLCIVPKLPILASTCRPRPF
jgi:hypothetical protein